MTRKATPPAPKCRDRCVRANAVWRICFGRPWPEFFWLSRRRILFADAFRAWYHPAQTNLAHLCLRLAHGSRSEQDWNFEDASVIFRFARSEDNVSSSELSAGPVPDVFVP